MAGAPTVTCARLSSRPPIITTSAAGCSARAAAIGGELVSTVQVLSAGSRRASSRFVVEPSRTITRASRRTSTAARASGGLLLGTGLAPVRERAGLRRRGQRAAVHALHEALRRQLAQVAPDGVLGHSELLDEPGRHDLSVAGEPVEDRLAALDAEKGCTFLHENAWYCMFLPESRQSTARFTSM